MADSDAPCPYCSAIWPGSHAEACRFRWAGDWFIGKTPAPLNEATQALPAVASCPKPGECMKPGMCQMYGCALLTEAAVMSIDDYQQWFRSKVQRYGADDLLYLSGKMMTEAAEVCDPIFKLQRELGSRPPRHHLEFVLPDMLSRAIIGHDGLRAAVKEELSDTLWYILLIAMKIKVTGSELLEFQKEKITKAQKGEEHGGK